MLSVCSLIWSKPCSFPLCDAWSFSRMFPSPGFSQWVCSPQVIFSPLFLVNIKGDRSKTRGLDFPKIPSVFTQKITEFIVSHQLHRAGLDYWHDLVFQCFLPAVQVNMKGRLWKVSSSPSTLPPSAVPAALFIVYYCFIVCACFHSSFISAHFTFRIMDETNCLMQILLSLKKINTTLMFFYFIF